MMAPCVTSAAHPAVLYKLPSTLSFPALPLRPPPSPLLLHKPPAGRVLLPALCPEPAPGGSAQLTCSLPGRLLPPPLPLAGPAPREGSPACARALHSTSWTLHRRAWGRPSDVCWSRDGKRFPAQPASSTAAPPGRGLASSFPSPAPTSLVLAPGSVGLLRPLGALPR